MICLDVGMKNIGMQRTEEVTPETAGKPVDWMGHFAHPIGKKLLSIRKLAAETVVRFMNQLLHDFLGVGIGFRFHLP